jgi:hypothetical protein
MFYETVYDFARDEYWASFYLKITLGLILGVPLFMRFLGRDNHAGIDDVLFIGPFTAIVLLVGSAIAIQSDQTHHRILAQNTRTIEGPISSLGFYGGGRGGTTFKFCLPDGCFSGYFAQGILGNNSTAKNGDFARVKYTHGSKIINIALAKGERMSLID